MPGSFIATFDAPGRAIPRDCHRRHTMACVTDPTCMQCWQRRPSAAASGDQPQRSLILPRGFDLPDELAEAFEIGARELRPLRLGELHRVDGLAVVDHLEVQVWAGRSAGVADEADELPELD